MAKLDLSALADDSVLSSQSTTQDGPKCAPRAPLALFVEDEDQPRTEFEDADPKEWQEFVESVRAYGVMQPVIVVRQPDGKLKIRYGARRIRASRLIGLPDAPYLEISDPRQMDDYSQVHENEKRRSLQPLELANFIKKKLNQGEKKGVVAKKIGIDPSELTRLLSLIEGPPILLELYESRKCRAPHYLYELGKLHEINAEVVEARVKEVDEITKNFLVTLADELKPKRQEPSQANSSATGTPSGADGEAGDGSGSSASGASGSGTGGEEGNGGNQASAGSAGSSAPTDGAEGGGNGNNNNSNPGAANKGSAGVGDLLRRPSLLCVVGDRAGSLLLTKKPTKAGRAYVAFSGESDPVEVDLAEVRLTQLTEAAA